MNKYFKILTELKNDSIQLGDLGIGFIKTQNYNNKFNFDNHKFIRGNHDNPEICKKHKNYLGDYGITSQGLFFISGADSLDKKYRTPMINWWQNEELTTNDFKKCLNLYKKEKPEIKT